MLRIACLVVGDEIDDTHIPKSYLEVYMQNKGPNNFTCPQTAQIRVGRRQEETDQSTISLSRCFQGVAVNNHVFCLVISLIMAIFQMMFFNCRNVTTSPLFI